MVGKEIWRDVKSFAVGMRVLAVDDDPICLKILDGLLRQCQYNTTVTSDARTALKMLRENKDNFDLVISDVHMPGMDGFKLLEEVGLEMDLPVIMMSINSDPELVMKGVTHGACDYLVKPVRMEELCNIWQHVIRKSGKGKGSPLAANNNQKGKLNRKRNGGEVSDDDGSECEDNEQQKKARVVWTLELHTKFVNAFQQLEIKDAVPKKILEIMNDNRITRENVASHLQKYRKLLKKLSEFGVPPAKIAALGANESFVRMKSLDRLRPSSVSPNTNGAQLNGLGNVNLRNFTPSTLVQPSKAQNMSSLYQGIQSSLKLDQLQQNKGAAGAAHFNAMNNSSMLRTSSTFMDTRAYPGCSKNLFNNSTSSPLMPSDRGGCFILNQSAADMASLTPESFTTGVSGPPIFPDPGKCNGNWQNTVESVAVHSNSMLFSAEPFHSQLPFNGTRDINSWNGSYVQNNHVCPSLSMVLPPFEDSMGGVHHMNQVPGQSWAEQRQNGFMSNISQIPVSGIMSNSVQSSGFLNQKMDMYIDGTSAGSAASALMQQQNDDGNLVDMIKHVNPQSQTMNDMVKQELDGTVSNGDFLFDVSTLND